MRSGYSIKPVDCSIFHCIVILLLYTVTSVDANANNASVITTTTAAVPQTELVEICPFNTNAYGNPCTHTNCDSNVESMECLNVI